MPMNSDSFYNRQIVFTEDGSVSFFLPDLNENYHSTHGAVQESQHVFMKMGWEEQSWKPGVDILEIGFGTGLNAWLVLGEVRRDPGSPQVYYTAVELYPVDKEQAQSLNYFEFDSPFAADERRKYFMSLHEAEWNVVSEIWPGFALEKLKVSLEDFVPAQLYDLIFFDAFAPKVQPEMWTKEVFDTMFGSLRQGGVLVTYCAKGEVRRNMIAAGFTVERVPGPPGKREMLRATKP